MEKAQRGISAAIAVLLTAVLAMVIAAPAHAASFIDVDEQTPHAEDITWLADHKISEGYPDKTFRPLTPVFRQDMAAFLYRLAGEPEYTPTEADANSFTDVNSQTPHAKEIWWLASTGISKGYPDGSFGPMKEVARCDMAAFLRRLAVYMGDSDAQAWTPDGISAFTDVSNGTSHAEDIFWLAYTKVSAGYPDCTFRPFATVVRQDMAAFLHRLDTHVASHAKPEPPASDAYELGTYAGYSYVNIKDGSGFEESEKVCDVAGQTDTMTIFYRGEGIYLYDYTGSASTLQIPARINSVPVISVELQKTFATTQQAPNLQRVDATTASDLVFMQVDMDHITSIAANGLPELKFFHSSAAALKNLACKSCPKLRSIYVKNTQLESIDLSGLPELMLLNLSGNQLASLDVSANPKLFELECDMNNIQDLNALKQWLAQSGHSGTIEPQRQAAAKPQAGTWNGYDYLLVSEACGFKKYDSITFGSDDASMTYYEPGMRPPSRYPPQSTASPLWRPAWQTAPRKPRSNGWTPAPPPVSASSPSGIQTWTSSRWAPSPSSKYSTSARPTSRESTFLDAQTCSSYSSRTASSSISISPRSRCCPSSRSTTTTSARSISPLARSSRT